MIAALLLFAGEPQWNCDDPIAQQEMNYCAVQDYRKADGALNAQWKMTYNFMKSRDDADTSRGGGFGYAAGLLAAQRAWLKYRDTECVIEGGEFAGGTLQPMVQSLCLADLTRQRTTQLATLVWTN